MSSSSSVAVTLRPETRQSLFSTVFHKSPFEAYNRLKPATELIYYRH
ncbi:MAG: hypothetical protein WA883_06100 [Phormidesmis sp.]